MRQTVAGMTLALFLLAGVGGRAVVAWSNHLSVQVGRLRPVMLLATVDRWIAEGVVLWATAQGWLALDVLAGARGAWRQFI